MSDSPEHKSGSKQKGEGMSNSYNIGSKEQAILTMVLCATRDQQTLIEAYQHLDTEDAERVRMDAQQWIEDFQRLGKVLTNKR